MIDLILRYFGYVKMPPEAVRLIFTARSAWEEQPTNPLVGKALLALEKLMRSAQ